MKLKKKLMKLALITVVTGGVCLPYFVPVKGGQAVADTPPAPAAAPSMKSMFPNVAADKVVLTIGDQKVTAGEVNGVFDHLDQQTQKQITSQPNWKRDLAEHFIKLKLMAAEAHAQKLDETPAFKVQHEQLLERALLTQLTTDKDANKKYFEDNKDWFAGLRVRHILISYKGSRVESATRPEAEAKAKAEDIRARLEKNADFVAIARIESDDRSSAATGGELGIMKRYQMVPAFEEAAYALKGKEISPIIKTPFGYHIIQVTDRAPATFEESADLVAHRRVDAMIDGLKKKNKTEIDESFFGPELSDAPKPGAPTQSLKSN